MGFLLYLFVRPFNSSSLLRLSDYKILDSLKSHIKILNLKNKFKPFLQVLFLWFPVTNQRFRDFCTYVSMFKKDKWVVTDRFLKFQCICMEVLCDSVFGFKTDLEKLFFSWQAQSLAHNRQSVTICWKGAWTMGNLAITFRY